MRQPSISRLRLWDNQERRLLALFVRAFELLQESDLATHIDENDVSRELIRCLREANLQQRKQGDGFDHTPFFNGPIQPDASDPTKVLPENKKPDFQHEIVDDLAPPEQSSRYYHVECKRLGNLPHDKRNLPRDYVDKGIERFRDAAIGYGRNCRSGAMIAYVQADDMGRILAAVNAVCAGNAIPSLAVTGGDWHPLSVTRLDHAFDRPYAIPPFELRHLWIDIRHHYKAEVPRAEHFDPE